MNIFFASNRNPHFDNTNVYREKAVRDLGHNFVFVDDRAFLMLGRIRDRFGFLQRWDLRCLNKKMLIQAGRGNPDLWLAVGGNRVLPETVRGITGMGIKTALWTSDVPLDFDNIIRAAPFYDYVFCAGTEAIEVFEKNGIQGARWLPFACDPERHMPMAVTEKEKNENDRDVVFVGAYYPNRWEIIKELSEFNVGVWGPGWSRASGGEAGSMHIKDVRLNYTEWVRIYNTAKIVMAVHYQDGKVPSYQASPKIYEALACRAFLITDRQKDVLSQFEDGKHLLCFEDKDDLKDKVRYYLDHDSERRSIADNGYREVLEKHTYLHRIREMLSVMSG